MDETLGFQSDYGLLPAPAASGPLYLPGDYSDAAQMGPFTPPIATAQGMPWWEAVIAYGATRAIDNRFAPPIVTGNTSPGSFAGTNGATYSNGASPQMIAGVPNSWLLLGAAAAVALYIAAR